MIMYLKKYSTEENIYSNELIRIMSKYYLDRKEKERKYSTKETIFE